MFQLQVNQPTDTVQLQIKSEHCDWENTCYRPMVAWRADAIREELSRLYPTCQYRLVRV